MKHYGYARDALNWEKWRLTFKGGDEFIQKYLVRFSTREEISDFNARKAMAYCPAFAKEAIIDIRNSITQRMVEVKRDGPEEYLHSMSEDVDGAGTSMTQYMGSKVLDELMVMRKVAVWVDSGKSKGSEPYLYIYTVEDILNWDSEGNPTSVLLRDHVEGNDELGLITPPVETWRHARVTDAGVEVRTLDTNKKKIGESEFLDFTEIPLVILEVPESFLTDVANYQVALLNVASSDLNYVLRANFPFYTEQYDAKVDMMQKFSAAVSDADADTQQIDAAKTESVGVTNGRRYPMGTERPGFISPPVEPLQASMEKQEQLKREIRTLVNLSLSNISPTRASRESKQQDEKGLEAGLATLGQKLEKAERRIAYFWGQYLGTDEKITVSYPKDYSLKSDSERQSEAEADLKLVDKLISLTAKKETMKKVANTLFGGRLPAKTVVKIQAEIDELDVVVSDPTVLYSDSENHLVGNRTASQIRGYQAGEELLAIADHTDKLARIAVAQSEAAAVTQTAPGTETTLTEKEKKAEGGVE